MPPLAALIVCSMFVVGIIIIDATRKPNVSFAMWVPLIWLAILASRPLASWLSQGQDVFALEASIEDGSRIDRAVLSLLIIVSALVLHKRRVQWMPLLKENLGIVLFLLYCGMSVAWSDVPAVAFKRWIRAIGTLMIILVVVSESDPVEAIETLVRRCSYILIPFSMMLTKYYRELGVGYNFWTGAEMITGVATDKNGLGRLCLVSGLFGLWNIVEKRDSGTLGRNHLSGAVDVLVLLMTAWLLLRSQSATSLGSLAFGATVLLGLGLPIVRQNGRHLGKLILLAWFVIVALGLSLNLTETAVTGLGRDMTFTDRTYLWRDLLDMHTNPLVGVGYDSFWLGDRLEAFVRKYQVNSAHDGYLEVYLELGIVGLLLFVGFVFAAFRRARESIVMGADFGRLRMTILFVFLVYNISESAYKATNFMFFILLLVAADMPRGLVPGRAAAPTATARPPLWRRREGRASVSRVGPPAAQIPAGGLTRWASDGVHREKPAWSRG